MIFRNFPLNLVFLDQQPLHSDRNPWKRSLVLKIAVAFVGGLLLLLIVLLLAPSENIWLETRRELEARGEILDWEKIVPAPVPDDQNIFADPVAASLIPLRNRPRPANPLDVPAPAFPPNSEHLGIPFAMTNLIGLPRESSSDDDELSLPELHDWFAQWDESFAQLREVGRRRPHAHLPGDYSSPYSAPMLNFVAARNLTQVLVSRARVHMLLGDSASALEDIETLAVLMKSFQGEPGTLVMAMIHVAISGLYLDAVEDGLRQNVWTEAELRNLIAQLTAINLLEVVEQGMRAERAGVVRYLDALAERKRDPLYRSSLDAFTSDEWTVHRVIVQFSPSSWIRRNQAHYARTIQGYLDALDPTARQIDIAEIDRINSELTKSQSTWNPKSSISAYATPAFSKAAATVARNQARSDQLAVGCALELFRARNKSYPDDLDQLVPEFIPAIPRDIYTGEGVLYSRSAKGYEISAPQSIRSTATPTFIWTNR